MIHYVNKNGNGDCLSEINIETNKNSDFISWDWAIREQNVERIEGGTFLKWTKNKIRNTS